MNSKSSCIAVFKSHLEAENAVKALQKSGFDMKKLSIVARDYHSEEHVVGYYNAGEQMKYWGQQGAFWGSLWGVLIGAAFLWIPGVGPVVVAGPLVTWIIAALEGAVVGGGLGAIGAGLNSLGVPKDSVIQYDVALTAGKFLLVASGTEAETGRAKEAIRHSEPELSNIHLHEFNGNKQAPTVTHHSSIQL